MDNGQRLSAWTAGRAWRIERLRFLDEDVAIEGAFDPPPMARLSLEDQVFVAAFIRAHGSIKQMEEAYGLSYPTIKNRLRRLSQELGFLDVEVRQQVSSPPPPAAGRVGRLLDGLEAGDLSVKDVLERLEGERGTPAGSAT